VLEAAEKKPGWVDTEERFVDDWAPLLEAEDTPWRSSSKSLTLQKTLVIIF